MAGKFIWDAASKYEYIDTINNNRYIAHHEEIMANIDT